MAGGSMMAQIVMRKCDVTYKKAKKIVQQARFNLFIEDESMIWSKELQAECFRLVDEEKEKARKEKEAAMSKFDIDIKPVPVASRRLSGQDFDSLFGFPSPDPPESPPERRARPKLHRQRSKSLTLPETSRRNRNEDCRTISSDNTHQRHARGKSETRKKVKNKPILHEHLDENSNHERTPASVANETDCAVVGSSSIADDTNCGVVPGASKTPFSIRSRVQVQDNDHSDSTTEHDNDDDDDDDPFVQRKSLRSKELMMHQQRGRSKSKRKVSKDEQQDNNDNGAFVVKQKPSSLKSGELREMADAVRRRALNARDRSRSRSRVNRRSGHQQQAKGSSALGGSMHCDEEEDETENSDILDMSELDSKAHQLADAFEGKDSSAEATGKDAGKKEKKARKASITYMVSKEDFEAACQQTDNKEDLVKSLRRVSATTQRRPSANIKALTVKQAHEDEDPLALTSSPRRTQRHARRTFSSPTKKKKTKAPRPSSLDLDHAIGRAEKDNSESNLIELEDHDLNKSHSSMKSTGSKTCMVPVLRSPPMSPIRARSNNSPIRTTNSPNKSATAYVLSPCKVDSPTGKDNSTILRKSKRTSIGLKAAPPLDFGDASEDDKLVSPKQDVDNDSGTGRTVSTSGSATDSSCCSPEFAAKLKMFSNTPSSPEKYTNSHNDDRQQHTNRRPSSPMRRSKATTRDRTSLKQARKTRQSELRTT